MQERKAIALASYQQQLQQMQRQAVAADNGGVGAVPGFGLSRRKCQDSHHPPILAAQMPMQHMKGTPTCDDGRRWWRPATGRHTCAAESDLGFTCWTCCPHLHPGNAAHDERVILEQRPYTLHPREWRHQPSGSGVVSSTGLPPLPTNVQLSPSVTRAYACITELSAGEITEVQGWMAADCTYETCFHGMAVHAKAELAAGPAGIRARCWERDAQAEAEVAARRQKEKLDLVYPHVPGSREGGRKKARRREGLKVPGKLKPDEAKHAEQLAPIRLEFDVEYHKYCDTFVSNLNDPIVTPEVFAQSIIDDYSHSSSYHATTTRSKLIQVASNDVSVAPTKNVLEVARDPAGPRRGMLRPHTRFVAERAGAAGPREEAAQVNVAEASPPKDTALDEVIAANTGEACLPVIEGAFLRSSGLHSSSGDPHDSSGELDFGSGAIQVYAPNMPAQAGARLSDSGQGAERTRLSFEALSASDPNHVVRPGFGERRAAIAVRANSFVLKYPKEVVLYDYPVVIAPDVVSAAVRKHVFELLESTPEIALYLHEIAHGWTQRLVSRSRPSLLADVSATISEGHERVYTFKVLEPKELRSANLERYLRGEDTNYNPLPIISVFNPITTAHASHTGVPNKKSNPQSFYRHAKLTKKHLGYCRKSRIKIFGSQSARKTVFQCGKLSGMSSTSTSKHADDLPVVNVGNKAKDTFVPAELYKIEPSQPFAGVLSKRETLEAAKYTIMSPFVSAKTIVEQGLEVLGRRQGAPPINGSHRLQRSWNTRNVRFHRPAQLTRSAILVLADGGREDFRDSLDPGLRGVMIRFLAMCRVGGMQADHALLPLLFVRFSQGQQCSFCGSFTIPRGMLSA
ncbi:hypothetical protein DFH11DRAFT_1550718 [Phellopilus nigrolimitatus]|nr:hypothetical protein DFH11DRAFT_1550718 [Phellopilus nigrolimitatus]